MFPYRFNFPPIHQADIPQNINFFLFWFFVRGNLEEISTRSRFRAMFEDPPNGIYSPGLVFAGRSRDMEEILRAGCLRFACFVYRFAKEPSPSSPPQGWKFADETRGETLETRRQEIIIWLDCFFFRQRGGRLRGIEIKIGMGCLKHLLENFPQPPLYVRIISNYIVERLWNKKFEEFLRT